MRSKTIASTETVHREAPSGWQTAAAFSKSAAEAVTGGKSVATEPESKQVAAILTKARLALG
jgi:hypothetical protein